MKFTKFFITFLVFISVINSAFSQNERPNIIFIMTDDQSSIVLRDTDNQNQSRPFGFNGDTKVHTPIIDNLASNGLVFNNAFVSSSICSPSRFSILTGKYAGRSEGDNFLNNFPLGSLSRISNNTELEDDITNLPKQLQTAGYNTAFIGKSHIIDQDIVQTFTQGTNGFMAYAETDDPYDTSISDAMKFNHDKWADRMKDFGFDVVDAFYPANLKELENDALNIHNVEYKNKAVLDFIENSNDDPFFIYYSETIPHGPAPYWVNSGNYYAGLDADINITSEGVLPQDYSYLPTRDEIKSEISSIPGKELKHAWLRWFDQAVGAVIDKLQETGKLDNTLIIITSDHGDFNKAKATNYEGGIKVPLMMYWENGIQTAGTYDELVQNIDFGPTFLDLAGVDITNTEMDGKSLKEVIVNNSTAAVHDYLFFELGYSRAIRTKDWKYITVRYPDGINTQIANGQTFNGPNGTQVPLPYYIPNTSLGSLSAAQYPLYNVKDQLFDLNSDPFETINLFNSQPEIATELRFNLRTELLSFPQRPYQEFTDTTIDLTLSNDATSIIGKVLTGYQGWFNSDSDGSNLDWKHYKTAAGNFEPGEVTIDYWPDMSEATEDEKYDTPFNFKYGSTATVFSSANATTVNRHFEWMNTYGIDGAFYQQFANNLKSNSPIIKANDRLVLDNIVSAAITNNDRLVSVMFDLSGANAANTMVNDIKNYWQELVDEHGLNNTENNHILTYNQKAVVAIWGVGFNRSDNYDLDDVQELINYFKNDPVYGGCSVLLGVPRNWRTPGQGDAVSDAQLHDVIKSADIVHPWTVGRYSDLSGADAHKSIIAADKVWCDNEGLLYMPVVFPGFSWQNLKKSQGQFSELNSIPRLKGNFLWRQIYNAISENAETLYVAMFDEMDEGTCIFKVEDNPPSSFLTQFTNYEGLPNDYYLWLTGKAGEALRNEITLTQNQPTYPNLPQVTNYYVDEFGDNENTGTSLGTAFSTVHKAYDTANSSNTISISSSVIHNSLVNIRKSLNFVGTNNAVLLPNENKIGTNRLFHISQEDLDVSFSNITFQGNQESSINGGAINMNANSNLTFADCVFDNNSTGGYDKAGGALYFSEGNVTITNSIFKNNLARGNGGAISGSGDGLATITSSLFVNNQALNINSITEDKANGGAVNIFGDGRKVIMYKNTFYNNTATFQGGGLFFGGLNQESILENSTIFGNQVNLTSSENARGGGIRLEGDRSFVIKNTLIYGNILGDTVNPESDLNSTSITQLTLINSISGSSNGLGTDDVFDSSNISADLGTSNLRFDDQLGFVIYDIPPTGDDSPIDFGNDGNDAGAWDSMHVLSINSATIDGQTFSVFFNKSNKTLKVFSSHNSDMLITLYAINGAEVYAKRKIKKTDIISLEALKAGVYIISAVINEKIYIKKFILY